MEALPPEVFERIAAGLKLEDNLALRQVSTRTKLFVDNWFKRGPWIKPIISDLGELNKSGIYIQKLALHSSLCDGKIMPALINSGSIKQLKILLNVREQYTRDLSDLHMIFFTISKTLEIVEIENVQGKLEIIENYCPRILNCYQFECELADTMQSVNYLDISMIFFMDDGLQPERIFNFAMTLIKIMPNLETLKLPVLTINRDYSESLNGLVDTLVEMKKIRHIYLGYLSAFQTITWSYDTPHMGLYPMRPDQVLKLLNFCFMSRVKLYNMPAHSILSQEEYVRISDVIGRIVYIQNKCNAQTFIPIHAKIDAVLENCTNLNRILPAVLNVESVAINLSPGQQRFSSFQTKRISVLELRLEQISFQDFESLNLEATVPNIKRLCLQGALQIRVCPTRPIGISALIGGLVHLEYMMLMKLYLVGAELNNLRFPNENHPRLTRVELRNCDMAFDTKCMLFDNCSILNTE